MKYLAVSIVIQIGLFIQAHAAVVIYRQALIQWDANQHQWMFINEDPKADLDIEPNPNGIYGLALSPKVFLTLEQLPKGEPGAWKQYNCLMILHPLYSDGGGTKLVIDKADYRKCTQK